MSSGARRWALVLTGFVAAAPACGGSAGGGAGGEIALADWPTVVVGAACKQAVGCGIFADEASCEEDVGVNDLQILMDDLTRGTVTYDPKAAATCLAALEKQDGFVFCHRTDPTTLIRPPSCWNVFVGKVPTGGPCSVSEECADGACSQTASGCSACSPPLNPPSPVGGACAAGMYCEGRAYCDFVAGMCVPFAAGESCTVNDECPAGTNCEEMPSMKTCAKPVAEGKACVQATSCELMADTCDDATHTCTRRPPAGAGVRLGGISNCYLGFACAADDGFSPQTPCPSP